MVLILTVFFDGLWFGLAGPASYCFAKASQSGLPSHAHTDPDADAGPHTAHTPVFHTHTVADARSAPGAAHAGGARTDAQAFTHTQPPAESQASGESVCRR